MKCLLLALVGTLLAQLQAGSLFAQSQTGNSTKSAMTYINEFLYPRVVVCYDPSEVDSQFHPEDALRNRASALELHLRLRNDGEVVCSHDGPITPKNPKMTDVINLVLRQKGKMATVYGDGLQFFFMLEIFNDPPDRVRKVIDVVFEEMKRYAPYLSTAVGPHDPPRGITFVITGQSAAFYQQLKHHGPELNRLCIVENIDYGRSIQNTSAIRAAFQWALFQFDQHRGLVNSAHGAGLPAPKNKSLFNVRVWNEDAEDQLRLTLASGVDAMNARPNNIRLLHDIIRHQHPRGFSPSLAVFGSHSLLAWRGESSNNLYVSLGLATPIAFARQLNLTYFLSGQPQAIAPAATLTKDLSQFVVYEGTGDQKLWYVSGRLQDANRFLTFQGGQHLLTSGSGRRGRNPAVAVAPDGRLIVVYEGTDDQRLWYVSGFLDRQGTFVGREFELTYGNTRRGYTPSIAFDSQGHVVVAYRGTDNQKLFYVSGSANAQGQIIGQELSLTEGNTRRGSRPSVAIAPTDGRVVIAYEGTDAQRLFYVSGYRDSKGHIVGSEHLLTQGQTRRGSHPSVVFGNFGKDLTILYQGTDDDKFWFVQGALDRNGQLVGKEQLLDMGFELN